ncbi:TetR/AcrR family transcriptional regulator [Roseomonas elaeocarpi]|uniref:TetR/AcrR family transcriptional regulator n=1 Tax=Roseomonas elaeocarpi TaxID=907779 RepID=A0ABV6JUK0_9PROT
MPRLVAEREDTLAPLTEVFREHGYEGATLALLGKATGLGRGSLYHFFPGGKDEMVSAVLAEIDGWFEARIFAPLLSDDSPDQAIDAMFDAVSGYFRSGRRVCLMGTLALGEGRDRFAAAVSRYFARWIGALTGALQRRGLDAAAALALSEEVVTGLQGAIVLARALNEPAVFERAVMRMRGRLRAGSPA